MQKVVSINLGGSVFQVDEDAYDLLRNYIEAIRLHFKGTEGGLEIANDIEQRLAEMFQARITSNANLISKQMVEEVMALMGKPSDFDTGEQQASNTYEPASNSEPLIKRKLFRDPENRMIGGVCSGMGAYFGVGRWIFRVIALVLVLIPYFTVGAGFVVLGYAILWIAIPKAKSMTDRMQMKGQPINISSFEKNFKETFVMAAKKQFSRDASNKMIGGVCAGIANYFGTQSWVIRVVFLVALLFFGSGFLLYVILWIAVPKSDPSIVQPEAGSDASKINLNKESVPIGGFIGTVTGFIEEVLKMVIRFVSKISGFILLIVVLLVIAAFAMFSSTISSYWYVIFSDFAQFSMAKYALWFIVGIPLMVMVVLSIYLLGRKFKLNALVVLAVFFAWITACGFGVYSAINLSNDFRAQKENSQKITLAPTGGLLDIMSSGEAFPSGNFYFDDKHGFTLGDFAVLDSGIYSKWVELKIVRSDSLEAQLYYNVSAFGKDTLTAVSNQKVISYNLSQSNNDLILSPFYKIPVKSKWRGQKVEMLLKLPVGYKIRLNEGAASQLYIEGLPGDQDDDYDRVFDHNEPLHLIGKTLEMTSTGLKCTDC
jgi:phage shock protein PspC (stress-responsive transcriptional regulator)